jgi:hypothetical protein
MWFNTLALLGCLVGIVVCLIVAHHDGVMVGEERAYARIDRLRASQRRMSEGSNTLPTRRFEFYNHEERNSDQDATRVS